MRDPDLVIETHGLGKRYGEVEALGELDVQVDVDQNLAALRSALAAAGNDDLTVVVFDDANHLFQRAVTGGPDEYMQLEMAFAPGFLDTISGWLAERFGARQP